MAKPRGMKLIALPMLLVIALLIAVLCIGIVQAADVVLGITAPTNYAPTPPATVGLPLPLSDIAGYTFYYGKTPAFGQSVYVPITLAWPSMSNMTYTVTGLGAGDWYFGVTMTDIMGDMSGTSNVVNKPIHITPGAPTGLIIKGVVNYV